MIRNPYPIPTSDDDKATTRFQTYLSGEDKGLLFGLRPIRGTPQAVVNHLIKNLCNDLREHNITAYHPDADTIFSILVERRPLSGDQLARLRCAVTGVHRQVSAGVQQQSGGTSVRQRPTGSTSGSHNSSSQTKRRVQSNRKTKSTTKKSSST